VSGSVNYSREDNKNPPQIAEQDLSTPTVLYTLANSMPLRLMEEKRLNANGDEFVWSRFTNRTNPYFAIYNRFNKIQRDRIFGNLTARYNFTDWLYLQGRIGQDFYARDQDFNFPTGLASLAAAPSGFVNGRFVQESRRFRELNADFLLVPTVLSAGSASTSHWEATRCTAASTSTAWKRPTSWYATSTR
jgi:hypothetical protein